MVDRPSRCSLGALTFLGAVGLTAAAEATPLTCEQLLEHPSVVRWEDQVRQSTAAVIDLTDDDWLGGTLRAGPTRSPDATRVVAVTLPPHAPLVEVTCALGRRLALGKDDVLVVLSRFGLHAYAPALGYTQLRTLARRRNGEVDQAPLAAALGYASDVELAARQKRTERNLLGILGLFSLIVAVGMVGWMLRRAR